MGARLVGIHEDKVAGGPVFHPLDETVGIAPDFGKNPQKRGPVVMVAQDKLGRDFRFREQIPQDAVTLFETVVGQIAGNHHHFRVCVVLPDMGQAVPEVLNGIGTQDRFLVHVRIGEMDDFHGFGCREVDHWMCLVTQKL